MVEDNYLGPILKLATENGIILSPIPATQENLKSLQAMLAPETGTIKYCEGFVDPSNIEDDALATHKEKKGTQRVPNYSAKQLQFWVAHPTDEKKQTLENSKGFILFAPKVYKNAFHAVKQPSILEFQTKKQSMTYIIALCTQRTKDMPCIGRFLMSIALATQNNSGYGLIVGREKDFKPSAKAQQFYKDLGFEERRLQQNKKEIQDEEGGRFMYRASPPSVDQVLEMLKDCVKRQKNPLLPPPPARIPSPPPQKIPTPPTRIPSPPPQKIPTPVASKSDDDIAADVRNYIITHGLRSSKKDLKKYFKDLYGLTTYNNVKEQISNQVNEILNLRDRIVNYFDKVGIRGDYKPLEAKLSKGQVNPDLWLQKYRPVIRAVGTDILAKRVEEGIIGPVRKAKTAAREWTQARFEELKKKAPSEAEQLKKELEELKTEAEEWAQMQQQKVKAAEALQNLRMRLGKLAPTEKKTQVEQVVKAAKEQAQMQEGYLNVLAEREEAGLAKEAAEAKLKADDLAKAAEQKAKEAELSAVRREAARDVAANAVNRAIAAADQIDQMRQGDEGVVRGGAISEARRMAEDMAERVKAAVVEVKNVAAEVKMKEAESEMAEKRAEVAEKQAEKKFAALKNVAKKPWTRRQIAGVGALGVAGLFGIGLISNLVTHNPPPLGKKQTRSKSK